MRQLRCKLTNKAGVGFRVGPAKIVVEVEYDEHYAKAGRKFGKGSEQSYRVSATADSQTDALARADESMLAQVAFKVFKHRTMIAEAGAKL